MKYSVSIKVCDIWVGAVSFIHTPEYIDMPRPVLDGFLILLPWLIFLAGPGLTLTVLTGIHQYW